jgi:hypothetical protein
MSRRVMKYSTDGMSLSVLYFITLLDMTTITVIDHGMSLSVLYFITVMSRRVMKYSTERDIP